MAEQDDNSQEKTEQPSPKRLKEARDKGQVARSKDLNATLILLFTGAAFLMFGHYMTSAFTALMREGFTFNEESITSGYPTLRYLAAALRHASYGVLPLFFIILLVTILGSIVMGGFVFSTEALKPQFSRLSPLKGLKRMVSLKNFVEMVKAFVKFVLVAAVALLVLRLEVPRLMALSSYALNSALAEGMHIVASAFMFVSASLILIAGVDAPFQWYEHQKQMKMTKQELKDEYKETEGKPEVKSQIRKTQQDIARRRMMSEIPKADVVLTNPTHYAVALRYDKQGHRPPYVVAKGKDWVALQINKVAKANQVPVMQLPPLARAVYFSTKLNHDIPNGLYAAVAQVLAYLYQLNDRARYDASPSHLSDLPIPDALRKDTEESN